MTPPNPQLAELSKESQDFIRFMLRDHAFSEEFMVTAIQEYFQRNRDEAEPSGLTQESEAE